MRAGLKFSGGEKITIGGGEALWLYINRVKVVDWVRSKWGPYTCFLIDLGDLADGGPLQPQQGTISATGDCENLAPSDVSATLELEVILLLISLYKKENIREYVYHLHFQ